MKRTVKDVMTKTVVVVQDAAPFKEIARLMQEYRASALPVVDEEGRLLGIVSEADLLLKEDPGFEGERHLFEGRFRRVQREKAFGLVAGQLMTAPVYTVVPDTPLAEAARLMHDKGVKRLPVVDARGVVLGIVSRADVVKIFLRSDDEIDREIRDEVLFKTLWLEPNTVHVRVREGVVALEGQLERRSLIPVLVEMVHRVDGVIGVENRLSYLEDDAAPLAPVGTFPWAVGGAP